MRAIKTDLSNLDELIARQYEDKIRGFAKDTMQNSWEARKNRKKGTDFRVQYKFYKDLDGFKNVLMLEDFGTIGMNDDRWEAFHSHWVSTKGASYEGGIGRWGQGKTLLLFFSSKNIIITETIDIDTNTYKYSVRNNTGFILSGDMPKPKDPQLIKNKDGSLKNIKDFFPSELPLNHYGTRIWILDVKEDLAEEILKGELTVSLSESWWEIIRNHNVEISVVVDDRIQKVGLPIFPKMVDKEDSLLLSINGDHGKIKRLKIVLAQEPLKPSLRGIAIQRGGMTVCRYPFPASTPEKLRERCYGYCQLDDILDKEMWAIELANHEGFEARKAVWIKLRRTIDSISEQFILKHSIKHDVERLPFDLDDIIKTINKLVDEHLEGLGSGGHGGRDGGGTWHPEPIRISPWGYVGSDKRFNEDDVIEPKGSIINDTKKDAIVLFLYSIEGSGNTSYFNSEILEIKIEPESKMVLNIPEIELSKLSLKPGKYNLRAQIINKHKKVLHKRSSIFYYEQDPPILGGWLKKIIISQLGGTKKNYRNLPINTKGELLINQGYIELSKIWNSQRYSNKEKARQITPIIINIALHEATKEVTLSWWGNPSISFDIGEIKKAKTIFDEMWADYIRGSG